MLTVTAVPGPLEGPSAATPPATNAMPMPAIKAPLETDATTQARARWRVFNNKDKKIVSYAAGASAPPCRRRQ
ncbi:MAG TPA: hypothetical protein VME40_02605 [Caulobacteraceae bacterium]|nr:hypothetical protein [Caulobacteraceae bacterium]